MDPCQQVKNIEALQTSERDNTNKLHEMEIRQVQIQGDVTHVKTRIDNGMSNTIKETHDMLTSLKPIIEHHADIVKRIEDLGWLISRLATSFVVCAIIGIIIWAISKGFHPTISG